MANVFLVILLGIMLGIMLGCFGILLVAIGCFCLRRRKYLLGIFSILTVLVFIIGVVIFSAFGFDNKFSHILFLIIGAVVGINFFLHEKDDSGSIFKAICECILMVIIGVFLAVIMSLIILIANGDTHVFCENYTIEVFEDGVKLQYDAESMPAEGYAIIKNKLDEMRENGETYYEGTVKLKYSCSYPLIRNNHDECSCTDETLCDICKEYVSDVKVVYD